MQEKGKLIPAAPYAWPHDGSFDSTTTALIIIDMQRDFCEEGGYLTHQGYSVAPMRSVIPNITRLLSKFRETEFMIIHTREGHQPDLTDLPPRELYRSRNNPSGLGIGDNGPIGRFLVRGEPGHDTIPELYHRDGEVVIDKPGKGAFTGTNLESILRIRGVKNLILCGVTTDVCVHTTMREANDRGFDCLLVEDCCAAGDAKLHNAAIEMVHGEGGIFGATTTMAMLKPVLGP